MKELELKVTFEDVYDWYKQVSLAIMQEESMIGYIDLYLFNKKGIEDNMSWECEEELIDYIEEDLRISRKSSEFICDNLINYNDMIFINEICLDEDKRNNGYGSKALKKVIDNFDGTILLQASPLLKVINISDYLDGNNAEIKGLTTKLVRFYENLGFKVQNYPYMIK